MIKELRSLIEHELIDNKLENSTTILDPVVNFIWVGGVNVNARLAYADTSALVEVTEPDSMVPACHIDSLIVMPVD